MRHWPPKRKGPYRRRPTGGKPVPPVKQGAPNSLVRSIREKRLEQSLRNVEKELQSLRSIAYFDELCGIHNRRAFNDELSKVTGLAQRYGGEAAVAIFDVDRLKQINDSHGHVVGDIVLVAVAQAIKSSIRSSDFLARIGGDEFALILHHIDEASAEAKIADIRRSVAGTHVDTSAGRLAVTVSVGHSMISFASADEAIRHADNAMYRSKRAGRTIYQHT